MNRLPSSKLTILLSRWLLAAVFSLAVSRAEDQKTCAFEVLSFVSWPDGSTEFQWNHEGQPLRAISNIDLRHAPGWIEFECGEERFTLLLLGSRWREEDLAAQRAQGLLNPAGHPIEWPDQLPVPGGRVEYVVGWDEGFALPKDMESAFHLMDALHEWWAAQDTARITSDWQLAEARALESGRMLAAQIARQKAARAAGKPALVRKEVRYPSRSQVEQRRQTGNLQRQPAR